MKREDVYKLIDSERVYQDTDPHNAGQNDAVQPVSAWVIFIEQQINEAKLAIYNLSETQVRCCIRKIAALATACMEHNETLPRKMS